MAGLFAEASLLPWLGRTSKAFGQPPRAAVKQVATSDEKVLAKRCSVKRCNGQPNGRCYCRECVSKLFFVWLFGEDSRLKSLHAIRLMKKLFNCTLSACVGQPLTARCYTAQFALNSVHCAAGKRAVDGQRITCHSYVRFHRID